MNKKTKRKIITILILAILTFANIVSAVAVHSNTNTNIVENGKELEFTVKFNEKVITADFSVYFDSDNLTYVGASTEDLKTNYIKEKSEMICCYYDINKIGTDTISFKFKANKETNKTNIKVTNITVHTDSTEMKINDIISQNIKIIKANTETSNIVQNIVNNSNIQQQDDSIKNENKDTTTAISALPKTGLEFDLKDFLTIVIVGLILIIVLKNDKLSKKIKIIISIIIILMGTMIFLSKYVLAKNDDKIFINKTDKTILIVLSTSNEERNMSIQNFKEKTKAVNIDNSILSSGVTATFKNNEKYTVKVFRDENKNGYVNSSDIFELLNNKNINKKDIEELSNFIIKKEEFKEYNNIQNGYEEFNENSIITPNVTPLEPAIDRYMPVKNIEELKNLNANVGEKYKTLGYYEENDGGAGRYDIIEKNSNIKVDNGLYIELNNGLIAKLAIIRDTINVKQFGAKGNSFDNDTEYLRKAINSGIANVEIPKGEYKITDIIRFETPSTNIIGNNSTIFTDNDFNPEKISEFLFIMQSDNCNINNLNIEARETKNIEKLYDSQVYVGAANIKIIGCTFKVPETASSKHSYGNIDLYTGWHNVLIENCNLYLANDAKEGGCIWIRDLFNRGASDLTFINNKCYKKCHDEILAVFMGSIENVNILNNTFIMQNSTDPSTMCFTLGSASSKKAKNIKFEGNIIDTKATMSLLISRNATNLSIKNNKVKFERVTTLTNTFLIYFPENNSKDVVIENNNFEVNNNTDKSINGFIASNSENIILKENTITVNSDISEVFTGEYTTTDNNITFNGFTKILANKPKEFIGNHIIFNKGFGSIVQYYNGKLDWDSNIKNNVFENNYDEISANEKSILLMFNGGSLNNHIVNFEENTIKSDKANYRQNLIYLLNLSDEGPQTIKIVNNKINGYKQVWKDKNQEKHNIVMDNNT